MATPHPTWTYTRKEWKKIKDEGAKRNLQFPDTGAGKALDNIESLFKDIKWSVFEKLKEYYNGYPKTQLQEFYKFHATSINPFLRAIEKTTKLIKTAKKMPKAGIDFASEMENATRDFTLSGVYFSKLENRIKMLAVVLENKARVDAIAERFRSMEINDILGNNIATDIYLTFLKTFNAHENLLFLIVLRDGMNPRKIYNTFVSKISPVQISLPSAEANALTEIMNERPLELNDFADAKKCIELDLKLNSHWDPAVEAWKKSEYKKFKIPI